MANTSLACPLPQWLFIDSGSLLVTTTFQSHLLISWWQGDCCSLNGFNIPGIMYFLPLAWNISHWIEFTTKMPRWLLWFTEWANFLRSGKLCFASFSKTSFVSLNYSQDGICFEPRLPCFLFFVRIAAQDTLHGTLQNIALRFFTRWCILLQQRFVRWG